MTETTFKICNLKSFFKVLIKEECLWQMFVQVLECNRYHFQLKWHEFPLQLLVKAPLFQDTVAIKQSL